MKRFLTGASRAAGPSGLSGMGEWLIASVLIFGIVPVSVQAQGTTGAVRSGNSRRPVVPASPYSNSYAMNPYTTGSPTVNPSMSGNPYTYGDLSAQGSGAGDGGQGYGGTGQTSRLAPAALFGLPSENGRVQWPLGLQVLPPANETKALREQLEVVLYFVATQAAEGQVNTTFIDFGLQAVRELRQLLTPREVMMAPVTYSDAVRFLDRAERGLIMIKKTETGSGGTHP